MIEISTPGRICFYGDHQDYLGLPVISGTINRYIYLKAKPIKSFFFEINLIDFKRSIKVNFENNSNTIKIGDYFRAGLVVLSKEGIVPNKGYSIKILFKDRTHLELATELPLISLPVNASKELIAEKVSDYILWYLAEGKKVPIDSRKAIPKFEAYQSFVDYINASKSEEKQFFLEEAIRLDSGFVRAYKEKIFALFSKNRPEQFTLLQNLKGNINLDA